MATILIKEEKEEKLKEEWKDQPYVVSYNSDGKPGYDGFVVAANVILTAITAALMSAWLTYLATALLLELKKMDPERERKVLEGNLGIKLVDFLARHLLKNNEEPSKMVQVKSKFRSSRPATYYLPSFLQLPIR